jgi:tetratricopeptide (TPR) repeat protein
MERNVKWAKFVVFIGAIWLTTVPVHLSLGQGVAARESGRQLALALEQEGKVAEAEAEWRSLLSSQANDAEAYAHLGLLEARLAHYKEAIVFYHQALNLNPKMPSLRLNLGLAYFKAGELPAAIKTFEPLLKSEPRSSPEELRLVTLLGLSHYGMGEYAAAVPYLRQATAADPGNLPFRLSLAQSCLRTKQYPCVLEVYREILTLNTESAEADMLAGEAYDELKNDAAAIAEFQAAVKADPKMPDVQFGYGYLLWRALQFDQAEKAFRSELANNPEHPLALAYLGDTLIRLNRSGEGLPYVEHALRLRPSISIAHLDLGILYEGQGRNDDAVRELKMAENLSPDDPSIHWRLGRFYASTGRKAEAKAEFDKTRNMQQAKKQSVIEQMQQIEARPAAQNTDPAPR